MKRIAALLAVGLLLAATLIFVGTRVPPTTGQRTEAFLHCGLRSAGVEFEGQTWRFVTDDLSPNPPWFNVFAEEHNWGTFTIAREGNQVLAYGPLLTVHRVVPVEEGDGLGGCL